MPVLRAVGEALPPGAEVVLVPGNHDHHLIDGWRARSAAAPAAPPLGLESAVALRDGDPLAEVARALGAGGGPGGPRVRAAYPGVWLRDDVYAMHGHYGDLHTTVPQFERLAAGAMARRHGLGRRLRDGGPLRAEEYEAVLAPLYAWLHAVAQNRTAESQAAAHGAGASAWRALTEPLTGLAVRRRAARGVLPAAVWAIARGLGPLSSDLSLDALRRAGLAATAAAAERLGVGAAHVVFGHTHRGGPLPGDAAAEWRWRGGSLWNTGSWLLEPDFLGGRGDPASGYWPGRGVRVGADGPPEPVALLGDLPLAALSG